MPDDKSSKSCAQCKLPLGRRERFCQRCGAKVAASRSQFLTLAPSDVSGADGGQTPTIDSDTSDKGGLVGTLSDEIMREDIVRQPPKRTPLADKTPPVKRIQRKELVNVLNSLSAADQEILKLKWGFTDGRCHSNQEICEKVGVTIEQIQQLEAQVFNSNEPS